MTIETTTTGAATRARTSWMAWAAPPDEVGDQPTHAVASGTTVALCGVDTACQGAPWPAARSSWAFSLAPCRECAAAVEGA